MFYVEDFTEKTITKSEEQNDFEPDNEAVTSDSEKKETIISEWFNQSCYKQVENE